MTGWSGSDLTEFRCRQSFRRRRCVGNWSTRLPVTYLRDEQSVCDAPLVGFRLVHYQVIDARETNLHILMVAQRSLDHEDLVATRPLHNVPVLAVPEGPEFCDVIGFLDCCHIKYK